MKKAISVLLALCLAVCLCVPAFAEDDALLVECALFGHEIYVRFSPSVTDVAEDFYAEGIAMRGDEVFIHLRIDSTEYTIFRREQIEIVFHFDDLYDEESYRGTNVFDLVLHGLILSDGSRVDQTVVHSNIGPITSYIRLEPDENDKLVYEEDSAFQGPVFVREYYVPVGSQWPLQYDEDGLDGDAYLQAHAEMTVDGVEPQIQDGTVTFTSLGDCTITLQYCGDFNKTQIVVHVVRKSEVKRKLIAQLPFEAFGYGMAVGYWLGPWWLPISLPLGVMHAVAKCIVILLA